MVKFKELGFKDFDEYKSYFFDNLLSSNKTYDYFVDWTKVKEAVNQHLIELSLLNSLTKVEPKDIKKHLQDLLLEYPQVVEVIPLLIAERIRNGKIDIFEPSIEEFITFEFERSRINESNVYQIVNFCHKTGILDLFQEVTDIHDYLLGVEVGLDTNARKNRSGDIFERMCQQKIKKLISTEDYVMVENDSNFSLYPVISKEESKGKTHDIVIYKNNSPILIIECNFYNVVGSKPISIAESYIEMNRAAKEKGIDFLWITDGPAWHHMKEPLLRSMKEIDWILNFKMLDFLRKILKV
ncbi:DpnII family type II restriction endonuclease [Dictyoglomus thermophilum]|uniref:Type-2 restriction enzyme n=1 Tax=Dictyoglomus thermophilum (strain ATCC 35947 / DSM 3960 / H-6-12) TaxID=309799 RepID=B5YB85_DICT6|nr:DpnII family type II restriction endonuclease [Dictyoglomus thermophilum]ACI19398.1 type II restriction enzyme DpnII [Dictyoglomus thermophilum H-6-12]